MSRSMGVTFSDALHSAIMKQAAKEGGNVQGGPQAVVRRAVKDYLNRRGFKTEGLELTDREFAEA